jgi:hypothetical protein
MLQQYTDDVLNALSKAFEYGIAHDAPFTMAGGYDRRVIADNNNAAMAVLEAECPAAFAAHLQLVAVK